MIKKIKGKILYEYLEPEDYYEACIQILSQRKDYLNYFKKFDRSIEACDVLSFLMGERGYSVEDICKGRSDWFMNEYLKKLKINSREKYLGMVIIPIIMSKFKIYNTLDIDVLVYKYDRKYKPFLELDSFIKPNGKNNTAKINKHFKGLLDYIGITEQEFYETINSNISLYETILWGCEYRDELKLNDSTIGDEEE